MECDKVTLSLTPAEIRDISLTRDAIMAEYMALCATPVPNMGAALEKLVALKRLEALLDHA
jgi:hypothetical protein